MSKKLIIPAFLMLVMSAGTCADAFAQEPSGETIVAVAPDGQTTVEADWDDNSEEVNTLQESELARKMKQAQKAKDAETYDRYGGGITIIAMCIVLAALIVLSLLFLGFGSISSMLLSRKKKAAAAKAAKAADNSTDGEDHSLDSGETIAAIAAALSQHFSTDHDFEDTILTIRRMKRSYSPWNSKIYNMRHVPEHVHNPAANLRKK